MQKLLLTTAALVALLCGSQALAHPSGQGYRDRPFHSPYRAVRHYPAQKHYGYRYDRRGHYRRGYDRRKHSGHGHNPYKKHYRGYGPRYGGHHHRQGVVIHIGSHHRDRYRWCDSHSGYYAAGDLYYYD